MDPNDSTDIQDDKDGTQPSSSALLNKLIIKLHDNQHTDSVFEAPVSAGKQIWTFQIPKEWETPFEEARRKLHPWLVKSQVLRLLTIIYIELAEILPQQSTVDKSQEKQTWINGKLESEITKADEEYFFQRLKEQWSTLEPNKKKKLIQHWHGKGQLLKLKQFVDIDPNLEKTALEN